MDFSSNFNAPNIESLLVNKGIAKPTEMQKEMFSRDFTCNALLLSLDLKDLIDPTHQGFKDIKERMIKTCLPPEVTLTTNKNRVVTKNALIHHLWGDTADGFDNYDFIYNHVKNLRKKLLEKKCTDYLTTIYGIGYNFKTLE